MAARASFAAESRRRGAEAPAAWRHVSPVGASMLEEENKNGARNDRKLPTRTANEP
jgi:hypothetical protein